MNDTIYFNMEDPAAEAGGGSRRDILHEESLLLNCISGNVSVTVQKRTVPQKK